MSLLNLPRWSNQKASGHSRGRNHARSTTTTSMTMTRLLEEQKRQSTLHGDGVPVTSTITDLAERLPELLVFELHQDGSCKYMRLTVRNIYRYVLNAITDRHDFVSHCSFRHHPATTTTAVAAAAATTGSFNSSRPPLTQPNLMSTPLPAKIHEEEIHEDEGSIVDHQNQDEELGSAALNHPLLPPPPPPLATTATTVTTASIEISPLHHTQRIPIASSLNGMFHPVPDEPPIHGLHHQSAPPPMVTYRERLGGYLHPRDMRRLVTPFSNSNEPDMMVRRHVMLLNFDPLRAIILRDRLLVLVPDGADSLLATLEQRVRGGSAAVENSIFGAHMDNSELTESEKKKEKRSILGSLLKRSNSNRSGDDGTTSANHKLPAKDSQFSREDGDDGETVPESDENDEEPTDEWHEMEAREWINLHFELQCADAVLHVVGSILSEDTYELQQTAMSYIERVIDGHGGMNDDPLTIIRVVKDAVQLMTTRVKGFVKSMQRMLDDDEDMALMNLSRLVTHPERFIQPVPQQVLDEESNEPELILEANLQIALTLTNYLEIVQGQINTAKELIDQKLDATRNRLLLANMMISVLTLCVTMCATVGSFFGMNVPIPNNTVPRAFAFVVGWSVAGATALCFFIMAVLWYSGTIPHTVRVDSGRHKVEF